jgi:hypothetical protein
MGPTAGLEMAAKVNVSVPAGTRNQVAKRPASHLLNTMMSHYIRWRTDTLPNWI